MIKKILVSQPKPASEKSPYFEIASKFVMSEAMVRDVFGDPATILDSDRNPEYLYRKLKAEGREIPKIYMAIGTEDSLYVVNQDFRQFLENENADFFYEDGPGAHTCDFWNEYLPRGLEWALK